MDEEESVAWMADPFPDVRVIYSNVHPLIVVDMDGEEVEGKMHRIDASTLTGVIPEFEVILSD